MAIDILFKSQLWLITLVLIVLMLIAAVVGNLWGRFLNKKYGSQDDASNFIPSTILGLLALVLGFTFSMAVSRFDSRRNMILQEANAIGTAVLRVDFMPKEFQVPLRDLFKDYIQVRIDYHRIRGDEQRAREIHQRTSDLQGKIWAHLRSITEKNKDPITALMVNATNEVFDVSSEREQSSKNRIPELVYFLLFFICFAGIGSLGYLGGRKNENNIFNVSVLTILFALVMGLIMDIDRPQRGLIQTNQEPLIQLQQSLKD